MPEPDETFRGLLEAARAMMAESAVRPSLEVRREMAVEAMNVMPVPPYEESSDDFGALLELIRDQLGPDGDDICRRLEADAIMMVLAAKRTQQLADYGRA
jgi:hypothetical protein